MSCLMGQIRCPDLHKVVLGHKRKGVIENKISNTPFLYDYVSIMIIYKGIFFKDGSVNRRVGYPSCL